MKGNDINNKSRATNRKGEGGAVNGGKGREELSMGRRA